ncbi:MAG TPA: hypothetical protein EYP68_00020 [Candidatus Korarchaeota archaeon]|nr:hypothetical protein [Candidatus Korarchaeota archaeon]
MFEPVSSPSAEALPPWFDFGTVYVNSIISGSCRIENANMISVKSHPNWIIIDREDPNFPPSSTSGKGMFEFHLDTSEAGSYSGNIVVETDAGDIEISVSVVVRDVPSPKLKMLVYLTPFHKYSTKDPTRFESLTDLMASNLINVSYVSRYIWGQKSSAGLDVFLQQYGIVLLDGYGVLQLSNEEIRNIFKNYVMNGGNLIICADYFYRGTVDIANLLINEFGLSMRDEEYGHTVDITNLAPHPLTEGVNELHMHRPSPIEVTSEGAIILARPSGVPESEGVIAISEQGEGTILVIGSSLWWFSFLFRGREYDNSKILANFFEYVKSRSIPTGPSVTGEQDFEVSIDPSSLAIFAGQSMECTVTVTSISGFSSEVSLSISLEPSTSLISVLLSPSAVTPPSDGSVSAILVINTKKDVPAGAYTITVSGTSEGKSRSATLILAISSVQESPTTPFGGTIPMVGVAAGVAVALATVGIILVKRSRRGRKEEIVEDERIRKLEQALKEGRISEETYKELRKKYEREKKG